jgi:hypothetical protein
MNRPADHGPETPRWATTELGWLPLPPGPASLRHLLQVGDADLNRWWASGSIDAVETLVRTWTEVTSHAAFAGAELDFRMAMHDQLALALCWLGLERRSIADLDRAVTLIRLVRTSGVAWMDDAEYHQYICQHNLAYVRGSRGETGEILDRVFALARRRAAGDTRLRPRCLDLAGRIINFRYETSRRVADLDHGPHLVALVRAGARFDKGVMVERPDDVQEVAA